MKSPLRLVVWALGLWIGAIAGSAWSDGVQVPEQQKVREQQPAQAAPQRRLNPLENCRCQGHQGPAAERIRAVLGEPLSSAGLEFTEEPLENVVNFLQDEYEIPILLDVLALEESGISTDSPTTANLRNISLGAALRLMLKTKMLAYVICDEVLLITTPDEANAQLVACVYDVRDLVRTGRGNKDFDAVIDMLTRCVATTSWAENGGGEAAIRPLEPGLLVISQTQAVHEEIRELLALIRTTLQEPVEAQKEAAEVPDDLFGGGRGMDGAASAGHGREMGGHGVEADDPFE